MKRSEWIKAIDAAIGALEVLENLRDQFESKCGDKSDTWQESDRASDAQTIYETPVQGMLDDLADMRANVEAY